MLVLLADVDAVGMAVMPGVAEVTIWLPVFVDWLAEVIAETVGLVDDWLRAQAWRFCMGRALFGQLPGAGNVRALTWKAVLKFETKDDC